MYWPDSISYLLLSRDPRTTLQSHYAVQLRPLYLNCLLGCLVGEFQHCRNFGMQPYHEMIQFLQSEPAHDVDPTYLALKPSDPHAPTRTQKALSDAPHAPAQPNPPVQKFTQHVFRAQLGHDEGDGASPRRPRPRRRPRQRGYRREQRAHERRVVDAVHDEQHVRRICVNIDLALRRVRPVKRRYGDRRRVRARARGSFGGRNRPYVFSEEREERGYVCRGVPARQGAERNCEKSRSSSVVVMMMMMMMMMMMREMRI